MREITVHWNDGTKVRTATIALDDVNEGEHEHTVNGIRMAGGFWYGEIYIPWSSVLYVEHAKGQAKG